MDRIKRIFKKLLKRYGLDAFSAMALGLFSSLIIGLILSQISKIPGLGFIKDFSDILSAQSPVIGAAIGVAVAHGLGAKPLVLFSSAATGAFGYSFMGAGPMGAFVAAVVGAEFGRLVAGKTRVDIVLVPTVTILAGGLAGKFFGPYISNFMVWLGVLINNATTLHPIPMGILVSISMGMILTAPISSAALAISMQLSGLAAGAATVGCSTQMIGFAVASYRENKMGGLIAQGLGTSMLQVPNIIRKPIIWIPPILASAILGPVSSAILRMESNPIGAGMGTSGLVGQFALWATMEGMISPWLLITEILLMHFILPALLTLLFSEFMRKKKWITYGDMELQL
ncbi:MAG: PTS sugar transporter subunit IIC [Clostridiales bacterium]|nr:PTS sugar transporter subunit IIC [Clostridiales bacterium]